MRFQRAVLLLISAGSIANAHGGTAELPANLQAEVQRLGCQVPDAESVIRGQFERAGLTDWAVLCSKARTTTLLVFWNGKELGSSELLKTYDGDGQHLATRRIVAVDKKFIVKYCEGARGNVAAFNHQGVRDGFNGEVVHYYHQGKWLDLTVRQ